MSDSVYAAIKGPEAQTGQWHGHCTAYGTKNFASGHFQGFHAPPEHFRPCASGVWHVDPLTLSSVGIGTYLGSNDQKTDEEVENAVVRSVAEGWNVIDSAANYRNGHAESSVGRALCALHLAGGATRDQLFISTKAGFAPQKRMLEEMVKKGALSADEVEGSACMSPAWLEISLKTSLRALHLDTIDLFYLHNVAESFYRKFGRRRFFERLRHAFQFCEEARRNGHIIGYGMATWDAFRIPLDPDGQCLQLQDVVAVARVVGGADHGFGAIQLPINAHMREAWEAKTQILETRGGEEHLITLLEAAKYLGVAIFSSGPLKEKALLSDPSLCSALGAMSELKAVHGVGAKLLQIARSTPGIQTALVGHKTPAHVEENVALTGVPPLTLALFDKVMHELQE